MTRVQSPARLVSANNALCYLLRALPCLIAFSYAVGATPPALEAEQSSAAIRSPLSPPAGEADALFDPTGYWVSLITQDWRYRMVVPGKGEYLGIPINIPGKAFADAWQLEAAEAAGRQCDAYGAPALMLLPERLHISWHDPSTLQVDVDAGQQTRLLRFGDAVRESNEHSLQGKSIARWRAHVNTQALPQSSPFADARKPALRQGSLEVTTTDLLPGLLRKNGVPYGSGTHMTEYWEHHADPVGGRLLIITVIVEDSEYLADPYVYNLIFKHEADGSKWRPSACTLRR